MAQLVEYRTENAGAILMQVRLLTFVSLVGLVSLFVKLAGRRRTVFHFIRFLTHNILIQPESQRW